MIGFSSLYGLTRKSFFNNLQRASDPTKPIIFINAYPCVHNRPKIEHDDNFKNFALFFILSKVN